MDYFFLFAVIIGVFATFAHGQHDVTVELKDGVNPPTDGKTQGGVEATITCIFRDKSNRDAKELRFKKKGESDWVLAMKNEVLNGAWANGEYESSVGFEGEDVEKDEFKIKSVRVQDDGEYECRSVSKETDEIRKTASTTLTVYAQGENITLSGVVENKFRVKADEQTKLTCTVNGGSPPKLELKIDGTVVQEFETTEQNGVYTGEIRNHKFEASQDGKDIRCSSTVETFADPLETLSALLEIVAPPSVTCTPAEHKARVGNTEKFTCEVTGKPAPDIAKAGWVRFDGVSIKVNQEDKENGLKSEYTTNANGFTVTLTVQVTELSFKKYTLSVPSTDSTVGSAAESIVKLVEESQTKGVDDGSSAGRVTSSLLGIAILSLTAFL